jgi:DNA end-binding protein Ku
VTVTKEMLDLAKHIVETKSGDFDPEKFEDRYENALIELLNQKRKGEPIRTAVKPRDTGNVVNLMDALRKSLSDAGKRGAPQAAKAKGRNPKKAASGQREMLMAISGKGESKAKPAAKETKRPTRQRKAG